MLFLETVVPHDIFSCPRLSGNEGEQEIKRECLSCWGHMHSRTKVGEGVLSNHTGVFMQSRLRAESWQV